MIPIKIVKFFFLVYIKKPNINQNIETESINKEIGLLQGRLDINEKSLNQFKNMLRRIRRLRSKQGQKTNLSKTKNIQEVLRNIFENKIKYIKKKSDLLKNVLVNVQKRKELFKKGLKKIAKCRIFQKMNLINYVDAWIILMR